MSSIFFLHNIQEIFTFTQYLKHRELQKIQEVFEKVRKKLMIVLALILAVGAGTFGLAKKASKTTTKTETKIVETKAETGNVETTISCSGTLEGKETESMTLPSGIKIKKILVSLGDSVKKGDKLASVYPASVAEVLLNVRTEIDEIEDNLEDLDEDELSDETSDDSLKKLAYDQQLKELEEMEDQLTAMLKSGYITATSKGIIGQINVSEDEDTSTQTTQQEESTTQTTGSSDTSGVVQTSCMTSVATLSLMSTNVTSENVVDTDLMASAESAEDGDGGEGTTEEEKTTEAEKKTTESTQESEKTTQTQTTQPSTQSVSGGGTGASNTQSSATTKKSTTTKKTTKSSSGTTAASENTTQGTGTKQSPKQGGSGGGSGASGQSAGNGSSSETSESVSNTTDIETTETFVLYSESEMAVTVSVDEADINSVKKGQTAVITLTSDESASYDGEITNVSNVSSETGSSVKYEAEITIDKTEEMLEGMSASAVISIEEADDVVRIPSAAVQEKQGSAYVYTKKDKEGNLSGKTEVTTGLSDGSNVEIKEGLSEGDTVYYEIRSSNESSNNNHEGPGGMGGGMGGQMPGGGGTPPQGNGGGQKPGGN